ncbi:MAG: hypothetical protein K2X82_28535 [Gemmataceae bacterium]|nr:hypothetical protein [Gemmataceae bacterium]
MSHLVLGAAVSILVPSVGLGGPPAVAPPPRPAAEPVGRRPDRRTTVEGVVTAVDGTSVTIRGFDLRYTDIGRRNLFLVSVGGRPPVLCVKVEQTRHVLALTLPTGEVMYVQRAALPARRFPVDRVLAAGGFHEEEMLGSTYRLADVRVGDEVTLWLQRDGPEGVCRAVQIERRPGGRVPPAPGERPDDPDPYHAWVNAYQDWEERGIPLPDKYDPAKLSEQAQRVGLQLRAAQAARERLAPPPRLAKPKPPGR